MRTTKRFTPTVLERFTAEGRGTGLGPEYQPWHKVSRGDPASEGRSHLIPYQGRHFNLLSDLERSATIWSLMCPDLLELREQFRLSLERAPHELSAYDVRWHVRQCEGTQEICSRLGVRHPRATEASRSALWTMTTDLLITLKRPAGPRLLAVSVKPTARLSKRKHALLAIERAYWAAREVPWLLITPEVSDQAVVRCLKRVWPNMLLMPHARLNDDQLADLRQFSPGRSLTMVLARLQRQVAGGLNAKAALWQSVLRGELHIDLRRGWRPSEPVQILTQAQFESLNPIISRRTAWK